MQSIRFHHIRSRMVTVDVRSTTFLLQTLFHKKKTLSAVLYKKKHSLPVLGSINHTFNIGWNFFRASINSLENLNVVSHSREKNIIKNIYK